MGFRWHGVAIHWFKSDLRIRWTSIHYQALSVMKRSVDLNGKPYKQVTVCTVRGVRDQVNKLFQDCRPRPVEDPNGPWVRWVKLEGTGFDFNKENLKKWLNNFGTLQSEFEKDIMKFEDDIIDDDDEDDLPKTSYVVSGKLAVKIEIREPIPQFLPAFGKKIKVHYRGIEKLCVNCYSGGHIRTECTNERVSWMEYVNLFKEAYTGIDRDLYGTWNNLLLAWKNTMNSGKPHNFRKYVKYLIY